jgi:hypothetical protein
VRIDTVRASREGHTYHDTWTARVALELLIPTTNLSAVAVEGLSTEDAQIASTAAIEIADVVRYRGGVGIAHASSVEVVQFKYSIADATTPMRATDVRKTQFAAWQQHEGCALAPSSDHARHRPARTVCFRGTVPPSSVPPTCSASEASRTAIREGDARETTVTLRGATADIRSAERQHSHARR